MKVYSVLVENKDGKWMNGSKETEMDRKTAFWTARLWKGMGCKVQIWEENPEDLFNIEGNNTKRIYIG